MPMSMPMPMPMPIPMSMLMPMSMPMPIPMSMPMPIPIPMPKSMRMPMPISLPLTMPMPMPMPMLKPAYTNSSVNTNGYTSVDPDTDTTTKRIVSCIVLVVGAFSNFSLSDICHELLTIKYKQANKTRTQPLKE